MFKEFKRKRSGYSFYARLNILCKLAQSSYTIKTLFSTVQPMIFVKAVCGSQTNLVPEHPHVLRCRSVSTASTRINRNMALQYLRVLRSIS